VVNLEGFNDEDIISGPKTMNEKLELEIQHCCKKRGQRRMVSLKSKKRNIITIIFCGTRNEPRTLCMLGKQPLNYISSHKNRISRRQSFIEAAIHLGLDRKVTEERTSWLKQQFLNMPTRTQKM
jgi:hypothetical protein